MRLVDTHAAPNSQEPRIPNTLGWQLFANLVIAQSLMGDIILHESRILS